MANAGADRSDREAALDDDLEELNAIVEELLTHARLHDRTRAPTRTAVSVGEVLDGLVDTLVVPDGVTVERSELDATVVVELPLFRRVLRNLLSNAVRYAESRVRVMVSASEPVVITIDDDGPGIPASRHTEALAPFGTLDERSEHGLGLAIAHEVVAHHGGTLQLDRSALGGLGRVDIGLTKNWPDEQSGYGHTFSIA